jgi:hypothetical protein
VTAQIAKLDSGLTVTDLEQVGTAIVPTLRGRALPVGLARAAERKPQHQSLFDQNGHVTGDAASDTLIAPIEAQAQGVLFDPMTYEVGAIEARSYVTESGKTVYVRRVRTGNAQIPKEWEPVQEQEAGVQPFDLDVPAPPTPSGPHSRWPR